MNLELDGTKLAWEMTEGNDKPFSTSNSDINVIYYANKIVPLCRKMYEAGYDDGYYAGHEAYGL